MPKLWNETIEAYCREVRNAILDTTAALLAEHGLRSVTMSQIAQATGIEPATLYEYFSGVAASTAATPYAARPACSAATPYAAPPAYATRTG
jgi:DNA-binding transcriptional regulator YbjK